MHVRMMYLHFYATGIYVHNVFSDLRFKYLWCTALLGLINVLFATLRRLQIEIGDIPP